MKIQPLFLAGEWKTCKHTLSVRNPYSGEIIQEICLASYEEIDAAIKAAQDVRKVMRDLPSYQKYEILNHISQRLHSDKKKLSEVLTMESGKPMRYSMAEVERAADTFRIAAEETKRIPHEYISLDWTMPGKGKEGMVKYFPIGITAGITPFNFPINLVAHKVAPALAAGCPIILKPASQTPFSAIELAKIIGETSLPKGAFSVLPCDRETGNKLVTDPLIQFLSFTGSPDVGWKMKENAGKKKVVLELGGNAAVLISEDADLEHAVNRCIIGGFAYSGQVCIHAQRIYVEEKVFDHFFQMFIERVQMIREGDPMHADTEISVMIDEANAKRVEKWIWNAVANGAKLCCGGERKGSFVSPAVLTNTNTSMEVNAEEVFGPVVIIEKVKSFEEGVAAINDSRFGLQCGVFTNHLRKIKYAFNEIETGGIILNDVPTFRVDHMPYGGVKDSGLGREGVKYAMKDYLEPRLLTW
jgi:acyl-CoA reductase-like NAD-dependent aldehyde dehydrogenase